MRKLYIKQKVFSLRDKFKVTDESGQVVYYAEGKILSWGKKLNVYYENGSKAVFIKQKVWSLFPRYHVFINGGMKAAIVKKFTFFRPRYEIDGINWRIDGSFWEHDYDITSGECLIAAIHKKWMSWGDCYELNILDSQNELLALAVALIIDCVTENADNG